MNRIILFAFLSAISLPVLKGQSIKSIVPTIPTSPQAESIKKHGEFGINYFTGIPDISIPLFEIDHHGYKLPVKLTYYPQPFKPGYNYDVFGHGWSLSLISCVSRSVKYAPDEEYDFKLHDNIMENNYLIFKGNMMDCNLEYDPFNVTLPDGSSFEMIIARDYYGNLEYLISNGRSVKVQCNYGFSNINSFEITDENGVKYTFEGADTPYIGTAKYANSYVSWQLTRIEVPEAPDDPLLFQYENNIQALGYGYSERGLTASHVFIGSPGQDIPPHLYQVSSSTQSTNYSYKMSLLTSVSYGSTSVRLMYENWPSASHNYVKQIKLLDKNESVKTISLGIDKRWTVYPGASLKDSTAQLMSVQMANPQYSGNTEKYSLSYENESYFVFNGTDHWGYLNAYDSYRDVAQIAFYCEFGGYEWLSTGMASLLTKSETDKTPYYKLMMSSNPYTNNRAPASTYYHGILKKIGYPTGGYTEFMFENNKCLTSTDYDGSYIYNKKKRREMDAGGFRIAKITNYTADNLELDTKLFKYGPLRYFPIKDNEQEIPQPFSMDHTNVGEPVVDPTVLSYASTTYSYTPSSINFMLAGLSPRGIHEPFYDPFHNTNGHDGIGGNTDYKWECTFSSNNFRSLLDGRPSVVYPEVTVYNGKADTYDLPSIEHITGKTVYKYDTYEPSAYDTAFFESPQYYGVMGNTLYYESFSFRYNTMLEKRDYSYTGSGFLLKRKELNSWMFSFRPVTDYLYTHSYPDDFLPNVNSTTVRDFFSYKTRNIGTKLLTDRIVTSYEKSGSEITTQEYLSYNERWQLGYKQSHNSRGDMLETYLDYPQVGQGGSTSSAIAKMVEKNIISPVIEARTTYDGKNVQGERVQYAEYPSGSGYILMPARSYKMEFNPPGTQYTLQDEVLSYTVHGNPVEFVGKDGIHSVAIWGYDDRYMVAMVKNATYPDVSAALNQLGIANSQGMLTSVEALDSSTASQVIQRLPSSAQVTTYTYRPLVGMTSTTTPNGVTTYYEYDAFNRLKRTYIIENGQQKTVQSYDYHYKQ